MATQYAHVPQQLRARCSVNWVAAQPNGSSTIFDAVPCNSSRTGQRSSPLRTLKSRTLAPPFLSLSTLPSVGLLSLRLALPVFFPLAALSLRRFPAAGGA